MEVIRQCLTRRKFNDDQKTCFREKALSLSNLPERGRKRQKGKKGRDREEHR